jgi:hypothetical protein
MPWGYAATAFTDSVCLVARTDRKVANEATADWPCLRAVPNAFLPVSDPSTTQKKNNFILVSILPLVTRVIGSEIKEVKCGSQDGVDGPPHGRRAQSKAGFDGSVELDLHHKFCSVHVD